MAPLGEAGVIWRSGGNGDRRGKRALYKGGCQRVGGGRLHGRLRLRGPSLVEGTASLDNFLVQAANLKTDRMGAYRNSAKILARQLLEFQWQKKAHPKLLVLHASNHKTSNTLALWDQVKARLSGVEIREVNLRNGTLVDCSGCPYQMCLHFGERGQCFYGGPIVDDVYPAVKWADGILLLCPNYTRRAVRQYDCLY